MSEDNTTKKKQPAQKRNFRRTQGPQTKPKKFNKKNDKKENASVNESDDDDDELCVICTEKLHFAALTPCTHKTCHKCSFRQLALFEKKACLICRTETDRMIFSDDIHATFNDLKESKMFIREDKYGIDFTSKKVADATLALIKYTCSLCDSEEEKNIDYKSYAKYKEHLKMHNRTICMICATHNYLFPGELKIYTPNQLKNHQSRGDTEGFKGHPMCAICSGQRFYSDDELYLHMREKHEKCHICDKLDPKSPQYFKNYNQLFSHFQNAHYICTVPSCLDAKFVVFGDELELQAHILKEHGDIIRGKPKFFQSELSTFMSGPSRVVRESNDFTGESLMNEPVSTETPEIKRSRLEERAKYYLDNSSEGFATFQSFNKDYDVGRIRAVDLLNAYKTLFTSADADVYLLIHNLSEIYPKNSKKFKELDTIYTSYELREQRKQDLPSLSSDPFMTSIRGSWGNAGGGGSRTSSSSRGGSRTDLKNLPTLKAPSPNHDPFSNPYQVKTFKSSNRPIVRSLPRTTIPSPINNKSRGTASALNNTVSFSPTYLQSKKSSSSASLNHVANGNRNKLADLNLESLPTPKKKNHIPPVNKVVLPDPKKWGKDTEGSSKNQVEDEFANLVIQGNGKGKKGKGKQKQLLFHIGI